MNNKGSQPIYDNKNLKDAGKYDFENVNAINKRNGEMIFDSTITYKEKEKKNISPILVTSIVSGILIVLVCIFAFTDLKYIIFPKKEAVVTDTDFEDLSIMHKLVCKSETNENGLKTTTSRTYIYNNDKVKSTKYEYFVDVSGSELASDQSYHDYMTTSFDTIIETYSNIEGITLSYNRQGNAYYFTQEIDLNILSKRNNYTELTDVSLDQNISLAKVKAIREGLKCNVEE